MHHHQKQPIRKTAHHLRAAIVTGDNDTVRSLIGQGINLNHLDAQLQSLLHTAAESNNLYACQQLLEHAPHLINQATSGVTPLMLAVLKGHTDAVALLLRHGAIPTKRIDSTQENAMHLYTRQPKNTVICQLLLTYGRKRLDRADRITFYPLERAVLSHRRSLSSRNQSTRSRSSTLICVITLLAKAGYHYRDLTCDSRPSNAAEAIIYNEQKKRQRWKQRRALLLIRANRNEDARIEADTSPPAITPKH